MGNKLTSCLIGGRVPESALVLSDPFFFDEGLGHSFCYVRPDPLRLSSSKVHHHEELLCASNPNNSTASMFRTISGASVSANTSTTPLPSSATTPSAMLLAASYSADCYASSSPAPAAAFDCSDSFCSVPLQPVPRPGSSSLSAPIQPSTPQDRGFLSGPIERGFMSGPIDPRAAANTGTGAFSGPIQNTSSTTVAADPSFLRRSFSLTGGRPPRNPSFRPARNRRKGSLIRALKRAVARTVSFGGSGNQQNSVVAPITKAVSSAAAAAREAEATSSGDRSFSEDVQWAQGKAGEDRVHVVISEEHGWVFVGIYDGFNGPDAPDYLLANLYPAVHAELRGLLWQEHEEEEDEEEEGDSEESAGTASSSSPSPLSQEPPSARRKWGGRGGENRGRWKCEWDHHHNCSLSKSSPLEPDHGAVLKALSRALRKTEDTYLGIADEVVAENPELALMGSCVLVMLMKGEDVYVMNVGDSRAVLAREPEKQHHRRTEVVTRGAATKGWRYEEPTEGDVEAVQLTLDHSTGVDEEVQRLRKEHPDDAYVLLNDRVKGSLKLTRAFGAGFLKQPKWNNALLEMFRIDYVGTSPYITCTPSVRHHRLGLKDKFLILSSDGLYQYLTNEEAVNQVESFFTNFPEGDPAQHLVEEVLFRAAKKAGMDFHELLEIPQGDRRQYHDDISVIVISLEGRIWRSGV